MMETVTIVGLLPNQADRIKSAYGDKLALKCLETDTRLGKIRATAESSDHVILMTKFIPHQVQEVLRHHTGLTYCNGGMSSIKQKLDSLL